jgi:hypothetical protein
LDSFLWETYAVRILPFDALAARLAAQFLDVEMVQAVAVVPTTNPPRFPAEGC